MKKLILLSSVSFFLMNCNKKTETITPKTDVDTVATTESVVDTLGPKSFCYLGVVGKDSVFATIDDNLGTITGKLSYKNSEKDSSIGTLSGIKSGDTLKLTYEFAAEGKSGNTNDIYFLQKKDAIIEGVGERDSQTGTKFVNENKIKYEGTGYKLVDCKLVSKALK